MSSEENNTTKIKALKQARQVTLGIALFGIFLFWLFNYNFYIMFSGEKYIGQVTNVMQQANKCYKIELNVLRLDGDSQLQNFVDCTADERLFLIDLGDYLSVYESKSNPHKYFVPYKNVAVKIFLIVFFIIIPFFFFFFGRL